MNLSNSKPDPEPCIRIDELAEHARTSQMETKRIVWEYGETADRHRLENIEAQMHRAIDASDPDLLRRSIDELDRFYFEVLDRQPGHYVAMFNWLVVQCDRMTEPDTAQLIRDCRSAINNNDVEGLKVAVRGLMNLLPSPEDNKIVAFADWIGSDGKLFGKAMTRRE